MRSRQQLPREVDLKDCWHPQFELHITSSELVDSGDWGWFKSCFFAAALKHTLNIFYAHKLGVFCCCFFTIQMKDFSDFFCWHISLLSPHWTLSPCLHSPLVCFQWALCFLCGRYRPSGAKRIPTHMLPIWCPSNYLASPSVISNP